MPVALILGVTGQDGVYLTEWLAAKGYSVVGVTRNAARAVEVLPSSRFPTLAIEECDCSDSATLTQLLSRHRPDEIYNLAARTSGVGMFDDPEATAISNGVAVARLLQAIHHLGGRTKLCQASSSEMFGDPLESPQTENTPFNPRSPYGAAKVYAHTMVRIYRRHHGVFASSVILFNHESPLRALHFVSRKVSSGAARIALGHAKELRLGNLDARRDWGFAGDYVRAMWLALQRSDPDDYIVATGVTHSVRELCATAFAHVGLDYLRYVVSDVGSYRADERRQLVGLPDRARKVLGWQPTLSFEDMVKTMVDADIRRLRDVTPSPNVEPEGP